MKTKKQNKYTESTQSTLATVEPLVEYTKPTVEPIKEKYQKYINQVAEGYLTGISYPEIMEILRWIEAKRKTSIPINTSCGTCVMDLIKLFSNTK